MVPLLNGEQHTTSLDDVVEFIWGWLLTVILTLAILITVVSATEALLEVAMRGGMRGRATTSWCDFALVSQADRCSEKGTMRGRGTEYPTVIAVHPRNMCQSSVCREMQVLAKGEQGQARVHTAQRHTCMRPLTPHSLTGIGRHSPTPVDIRCWVADGDFHELNKDDRFSSNPRGLVSKLSLTNPRNWP